MTSVVSVGPTGPLNYMDRSPSIVPYTTYEYRIRVTNPSGGANSLWSEVTTRPARKFKYSKQHFVFQCFVLFCFFGGDP